MLTLFSFVAFAQEDINLDVLQAPTSPAANLLEISNSEIQKPTDPVGFMALINQGRDAGSFAIDLAPYWLFGGDKITLEDYILDDNNIQNSLFFSFATRVDELEINNQLENKRQFAVGLKFSPDRGEITQETKEQVQEHLLFLKNINAENEDLLDSLKRNNNVYLSIKRQKDSVFNANERLTDDQETIIIKYNEQLEKIETALIKENIKTQYEELEEIDFKRKGKQT